MGAHRAGSLQGSLGKSWVLWVIYFQVWIDQLKRRWEHSGWWENKVTDFFLPSMNGLPGKLSQIDVLFFCFVGVRGGVKLWIAWNMVFCLFVLVSSSNLRWAHWSVGPVLTDPIWCLDWVNVKLVSYQIKQKLQKACGFEINLASESRMTHKPGFWVTDA